MHNTAIGYTRRGAGPTRGPTGRAAASGTARAGPIALACPGARRIPLRLAMGGKFIFMRPCLLTAKKDNKGSSCPRGRRRLFFNLLLVIDCKMLLSKVLK